MIYLKHWIDRIVCLIITPILIYFGFFAMHFAILHNNGPCDAQMISFFQAGLRGNSFYNNLIGSYYSLKKIKIEIYIVMWLMHQLQNHNMKSVDMVMTQSVMIMTIGI